MFDIKLTIISNGPFAFHRGKYFGQELLSRYIENLTPYFSHITICARLLTKGEDEYESWSKYEIRSDKISFLELPSRVGQDKKIYEKIIRLIKIAKVIFKAIRSWELIYIFIPSNTGAITYLINKFFSKPFFTYVASDWVEISPYNFRWSGYKKYLFYPIYRSLNRLFENRIVKNSLVTLVVGKALYKKHKGKGKAVYETAPLINLSKNDIFYRDDTCRSKPIKCLFVGSLIRRKGIEYLIEAIRRLRKDNYGVELIIVGDGELRGKFELLAQDLQIKHVKFLGYVENGPKLLHIYRNSDIFVLPTLSEGFPRVLYEAMSQSLPIVTTNVSGITGLMKNGKNAVLVPPRSPEAIAKGISKIIKDVKFRQNLIKNGRETVSNIFGKDPVKQLVDLLSQHFTDHSRYLQQRSYYQ